MDDVNRNRLGGLLCLAYVATVFDKPVDVTHLQHKLGENVTELDFISLCRCAKWAGLKARLVSGKMADLATTPLPAIVHLSGQYYVLLSIEQESLTLYSPVKAGTFCCKAEQFEAKWDQQIILLADAGLTTKHIAFGFSWFIPSIKKHMSQAKRVILLSLFIQLIALPLHYFNQRQTGQITARVREMDQIRQFLSGSALTMLLDLVFVGVFIAVLFLYAPLLTWIILGSLVLYFLFWLAIGSGLRRRVIREYEKTADNTAFLTESITGIETVKTNSVEEGFEKEWQTSLAGQVTQPTLRLAQVWQDFQHTLISLRRIGDILDESQEAGNEGLASAPELKGEVSFNQVRFRYNSDSPEVLKNLSLTVKAGEFIGITGRSGSGKSTLTKLLQRLYSPDSGQVLVDGMDLAIADPVELRRNMSVVLQESCLFAGTIADNIRQCVPEATDKEVLYASKLAGADDFIADMPEGYNTQVGEGGSRLSGGQRQRIALARALITNPTILILDEATSALDYESEAAIISRLPEIIKGRTVISIAHRENTLRGCHRVVRVEDGSVMEGEFI